MKELENARLRQLRCREVKRARLEEVIEKHADVENILRPKPTPGRPRIEDNQPDLLKTIVEIASLGSGADSRRRTEMLRCCRTLDDSWIFPA